MHSLKILSFQYISVGPRLSNIIFRSLNDKPKSAAMQKLAEMKNSYEQILRMDKMKHFQDFKLKLDPKAQKDKIVDAVIQKSTKWQEWYIKAIGLDEVQKLQKREIAMQDQLTRTQLERREIDKKLKEQRKIRNELQDQLHKINRYQDDHSRKLYMELICKESDVVYLENELSRQFEEIDQIEREYFTAFCNAIRDSHEKQRAQTEYTKYFGLILSIIGTFVGSILTMIINAVRTKDLVSGIEKGVDRQMKNMTNTIIVGLDHKLKAIIETQLSERERQLSDREKQRVANKVEVKPQSPKATKSYYDYLRFWSTKDANSEIKTDNSEEKTKNTEEITQGSSYVNLSLAIVGVVSLIRILLFGF